MDSQETTCPVCVGLCGVESPDTDDWHDCDFCGATGKVDRDAAYRHLAGASLWASEHVNNDTL